MFPESGHFFFCRSNPALTTLFHPLSTLFTSHPFPSFRFFAEFLSTETRGPNSGWGPPLESVLYPPLPCPHYPLSPSLCFAFSLNSLVPKHVDQTQAGVHHWISCSTLPSLPSFTLFHPLSPSFTLFHSLSPSLRFAFSLNSLVPKHVDQTRAGIHHWSPCTTLLTTLFPPFAELLSTESLGPKESVHYPAPSTLFPPSLQLWPSHPFAVFLSTESLGPKAGWGPPFSHLRLLLHTPLMSKAHFSLSPLLQPSILRQPSKLTPPFFISYHLNTIPRPLTNFLVMPPSNQQQESTEPIPLTIPPLQIMDAKTKLEQSAADEQERRWTKRNHGTSERTKQTHPTHRGYPRHALLIHPLSCPLPFVHSL